MQAKHVVSTSSKAERIAIFERVVKRKEEKGKVHDYWANIIVLLACFIVAIEENVRYEVGIAIPAYSSWRADNVLFLQDVGNRKVPTTIGILWEVKNCTGWTTEEVFPWITRGTRNLHETHLLFPVPLEEVRSNLRETAGNTTREHDRNMLEAVLQAIEQTQLGVSQKHGYQL